MNTIKPWVDRPFSDHAIERRINNSIIHYESRVPYFLIDYYGFILANLSLALVEVTAERVFFLGYVDKPEGLPNSTRIAVQIEHTLVLPGGRHATNAPLGAIVWKDRQYQVRLHEPTWDNNDFITEYSVPNILNIESLERYRQKYRHKVIFVPPIVFPYEPQRYGIKRKHELVTTFVDCNQPRRKALLQQLKENNKQFVNVTNVYGASLRDLLLDTKVLLNMHQTEHHHTLEELRILPALLCGTVVVAEDSPLKESVPYSKYIVWSSYADLLDTLEDVARNYDEIYDRFFGANSELPAIIERLRAETLQGFRKIVSGNVASA
jgi:hypothetical protein